MSNKLVYATFIIVFWISFPMIMTYQYSNCFIKPATDAYKSIEEPSAWDAFTGMWTYIKTMFQFIFIGIPCAPAWVSLIVVAMGIITALVLYLLVRGD